MSANILISESMAYVQKAKLFDISKKLCFFAEKP